MKIVCISDTHGQHRLLQLPPGDMLLHAGDFSSRGTLAEVADFMTWFGEQPYRYKVCIAGNHDFLAERNPDLLRSLIPSSVHYLENTGVELEGHYIWGSPVTPWFYDWAFNRHRGEAIRPYWEQIPPQTDILITHGPPYGIRDLTLHGDLAGCEELNHRVWQLALRLHVFGHIHEGYGITEVGNVCFVNASVLDVAYQPVHAPILVEV